MYAFWHYLWWAIGGLGTFIMFAARVTPEDASGNIAGWLRWIGIHRPPEWIRSKIADQNIRRGCIIFLMIFMYVTGWMFPLSAFFSTGSSLLTTPIKAPEAQIAQPETAKTSKEIDYVPQRIFVNKAPQQLRNMISGHMLTEQSRIITPFIGKWAAFSVSVRDVSASPRGGEIFSGSLVGGTETICHFEKKWNTKLELLGKGQTVRMIGKIAEVTDLSVTFDDCEFQ